MSTVTIGQIWADNDKRRTGRTLKVNGFKDGKALCEVLTHAPGIPIKKKFVRIKLERFRPCANGYNLKQNSPSVPSQPVQPTQSIISKLIQSAVPKITLAGRCAQFTDLIEGDWISVNNDWAKFQHGTVEMSVRAFDGGYDAKLYIGGLLMYSQVFRDKDLEDVMYELADVGQYFCNDLLEMFSGI